MSYISGEDRRQLALLPAILDEYVDPDSRVRIIDAFVDQLDVSLLGFVRSPPADTGGPGYDPRDLLEIYIYGYLNEVRSCRRLERECHRNVELMWLVRRLAPDFKTIADFRRDNTAALVGACRAFVLFCRDQGLFTSGLVAIDGSKFHAASSPKRVISRREIAERTAKVDNQITDYLSRMDEADLSESQQVDSSCTGVVLDALRRRRAELDRLARQLDENDRNTIVEGETDARPMGFRAGPKPPCYNVESAVDTGTHLIIHHEVTTHTNDNRQLHVMAKASKDVLAVDRLRVVLDAGYSNGAAAAACERDGIEPYAPTNRAMNNKGDYFDRSQFVYDRLSDTLQCPAGRRLVRISFNVADHCIRYAGENCSNCMLKPKCTGSARRYVQRHMYDDALERMNARIASNPSLIRLRRITAEHPFGTIKRMSGGGRFLTRGLSKVKGEAALSVLAYNILRASNLSGDKKEAPATGASW
jgi:transposase